MVKRRKKKATRKRVPFGTVQIGKGKFKLVFGNKKKFTKGSKTFRTRTAAIKYVKKAYVTKRK